MSQVSRAMLVVLGATVVLLAVWLVALRPKPVSVGHTPLAPTQAIPLAQQAEAASDAANAKLQAATSAAGQAAAAAPAASVAATASAATPAASAPPAPAAPSTPSPTSSGRRDAAVMRGHPQRQGRRHALLDRRGSG
jgi:cytoskeletal protein RodZ